MKKIMDIGLMEWVLTLALAATSAGLLAQTTPPGRINYQGVLRDASGNPLNGAQTMAFRFYNAASAGTLLWEETYDPSHLPQVTVTSGLFTLALGDPGHFTAGSETLFPNVFALHATVYLAVKAGSDAEMTPRTQIVSAPFAVNAAKLEGRGAGEFPLLASPNTWTGAQTFAAGANLPGGAWNSSGYVGIGTAAPIFQLDILAPFNIAMRSLGVGTGGYFANTSSSGYAYVGYGDTGIEASGNIAGGYFHGALSGRAYVGYGNTGIDAYGSTTGGYFHGPLTGYARVGYGNEGINAYGSGSGGSFWNADGRSFAYAGASSGDGIVGYGKEAGGILTDLDTFSYTYVGYDTYKIQGTGTVSFVQNHPAEKDKVIVYAAPEGDEVATYTRGTAKLLNGEARVKLGETFQWVTNPDIGLTAHLTPKGDCNGLYAQSVSTTEIVVKELNGGKSSTTFDYIVYGLRIGFEESSIVQEKQRESYIPSFKDHRERYAKYPELRAYNSLERFKGMESQVRGVAPASMDLSRAKALKDAIHEYDSATDPPVEKLFGFGRESNFPKSAQGSLPSTGSTPPPSPSPPAVALHRDAPAAQESLALTDATPMAQPPIPTAADRFPVSEPVEAGDVLVMDPHREAMLMPCHQAADTMLVGIATEASSGNVPMTVNGIVFVNVDASYAPVHRGDLLTTSPTPGRAMRAVDPAAGTIIGKALEPLDSGTGLIRVLVMLR